jgi:hypothetical protein
VHENRSLLSAKSWALWAIRAQWPNEKPILELIEQDRFVIGHAAFGKNTNAKALVDAFLRAIKHFHTAFGSAIHQNTRSFVENQTRDLHEFLFPHKTNGCRSTASISMMSAIECGWPQTYSFLRVERFFTIHLIVKSAGKQG